MTRTRVTVAFVILVAAAVALWLLDSSGPAGDTAKPPPTASAAKAVSSSPVPAAAPASVAPDSSASAAPIHVRLPEGTPAATVVQVLRPAADAGDPRAACRLALELSKCQLGDKPTAAQKAACEGVSPEEARKASNYLWQAAAAGNVGAMSRYARDPMLDNLDATESAGAWAQYDQNVESFLARAVAGGDVMALYFSWRATGTGIAAGGRRLIRVDPYMAAVYANAATPLLDPRRQALVSKSAMLEESNLPPDEVEKARAEAQRIRETYFAGAQRTEDTQNDSYMQPAQCDK